MNWLYRNVICPWQTDREIKSAEKFIDKMLFKATDEVKLLVLRYDVDREWPYRPTDGGSSRTPR